MKKELGIFILLVVLCAVTGFENPRFFSQANLVNMANLIGLFGIFSLGAGLVIITAGIDLSVGSMIALIGMLLVMALTEWHWWWPLALLFVAAVSMILGLAHGFLITRFKMQPFIVTLCGLLLYRGIARFIAQDTTKGFGDAEGFKTLQSFANGKLFGTPMPFVLLILISIVMWVVLHRSIYGRYLFAVGRNEEATRFSGINTRFVIAGTYVVAALLTGISGILFAFFTNSVSPSTHGNFYELYGIAAAVLGGCSLRGGEGSIIGILIGVALLQVLQNLVNLLGIPSSLNFAVMGAVVLIGVLADQIFKNRSRKKISNR
ncbi:MAG TPA: ABC transporter permease [Verrucomicrobiae bacterium]|nr:ABC transporter permease [Verrucomicrobiae bacterium]